MTPKEIAFDAVDDVLDTLRFYREEGMITVDDDVLAEMRQPIAGSIVRAISKSNHEEQSNLKIDSSSDAFKLAIILSTIAIILSLIGLLGFFLHL